MIRAEIQRTLEREVVSAARDYKMASERLVQSFSEPLDQGASGRAVSPSAEKALKAKSLQEALRRLHEFETRGIVPDDLRTPASPGKGAIKRLN